MGARSIVLGACAAMALTSQGQDRPPEKAGDAPDSLVVVLDTTNLHGQGTLLAGLAHTADSIHWRTADTAMVSGKGKRRIRTNGGFEVGGIYGTLPYSLVGRGDLNGYAKGSLGMEVLGIPARVLVDLGTDVPIRGQRNAIRFAFDAPKVVDKERWMDTEGLHEQRKRLDSLEAQRTTAYRKLKGLEANLAAPPPSWAPPGPSIPSTGLGRLDSIRPGSMLEGDRLLLGSGILDTIPDGSSSPLTTMASDSLPRGPEWETGQDRWGSWHHRSDSLKQGISRAKQQLEGLDALIDRQRSAVQRTTATMNAERDKVPLAGRLLKGIKRLEVGSCSPGSSEFLINGVNFQGVSVEYERKDLYLSFDRGRSFDDSWLVADPLADRLRKLNESLFFTDARELNPRRLTAIKAGVGTRAGTHFHVGYLYGRRNDAPPGLMAGPEVGSERNQVLEVDVGYAIKKDHLLRMVFARSVVEKGIETGEADGRDVGINDFLGIGRGKDQAFKVGWTSTFKRTNTRMDFQGSTVSPFFQSFGMGYVRNGSKKLEGKVDQGLGRKLRFHGRLVGEERSSSSGGQRVSIVRSQARFSYRPISSTTIRVAYMPVLVRSRSGELELASTNRMYSLGGDVRKRWGKTIAICNMDFGLYQWRSDELERTMLNHTAGVTVMRGDEWTGRLAWSGLKGQADSTSSALNSFSLMAGHRSRKGFTMEVALELSPGLATGWTVACSRRLGRQFAIGVRGASVLPIQQEFTNNAFLNQKKSYNCVMFTSIVW